MALSNKSVQESVKLKSHLNKLIDVCMATNLRHEATKPDDFDNVGNPRGDYKSFYVQNSYCLSNPNSKQCILSFKS